MKHDEEQMEKIKSPAHYKIKGCNFESRHLADEIVKRLPGVLAARVFNVVKYLVRAEKKNRKEDYLKAKQYLEWCTEFTVDASDLNKVAGALDTPWFVIISGICDGMETEKALLLNEIFRNTIECKYTIAKALLEEFLKLYHGGEQNG